MQCGTSLAQAASDRKLSLDPQPCSAIGIPRTARGAYPSIGAQSTPYRAWGPRFRPTPPRFSRRTCFHCLPRYRLPALPNRPLRLSRPRPWRRLTAITTTSCCPCGSGRAGTHRRVSAMRRSSLKTTRWCPPPRLATGPWRAHASCIRLPVRHGCPPNTAISAPSAPPHCVMRWIRAFATRSTAAGCSRSTAPWRRKTAAKTCIRTPSCCLPPHTGWPLAMTRAPPRSCTTHMT